MIRGLGRACNDAGIDVELSNATRTPAELAGDETTTRRYFGHGDGDGWDPTTTRQCFVPWEVPYVDKDGRVFPCCFAAAASDSRLGTLGDGATLETIWNGVAFRRFRDDLVDGETTPAICRRCTTVPLGHHPYAAWRAELVDADTTHEDTAVLRFRNVGAAEWTRAAPVHVGTARPRDGTPTLATSEWCSPNRAATTVEDRVPAGAVGTFRVSVAPGGAGYVALVADGRCWLPGTEVWLSRPRRPRRQGLRRFRPWRSA